MNHRKISTLIVNLAWAFALAIAMLPAHAAVPQTLNYQGQLASAAGVPVNGTVAITFKLYDAATGGNLLWSEMQPVTVSNGLYSVVLGKTTPLVPSLFGAGLYLGITVETDGEMTPRIALSSAPYAMQSSCTPGDQMDCYTGASATRNIGACKSGKRNCTSTGWGATCDGEVLPIAEVANGIDDDCNGVIDNGVGCFIAGTAYANGAPNPANFSCQYCNIALATTAWSNQPSSTVCSDGNACTTGDHCDGAGSCVGTPVSVNDGNACTVDSCNPATGAVSHSNVANGTSCGAGQTCSGGICQVVSVCGDGLVGGAETCDDGNTTSGDGCSASCGVESGFTCSGQPSVCASVCGDGLIRGVEACDDGNTTSGDGCSATCTVESGFTCSGSPSICI